MKLLLLVLVLTVAACASTPLSILDGNLYYRTSLHRTPVRIISIDGDFSRQNPRYIEPGEHSLVVEAPPVAGFRVATQKAVQFKVEPCRRYYLGAQHPSAFSQNWELVIDYEEDMAGCDKRKAVVVNTPNKS